MCLSCDPRELGRVADAGRHGPPGLRRPPAPLVPPALRGCGPAARGVDHRERRAPRVGVGGRGGGVGRVGRLRVGREERPRGGRVGPRARRPAPLGATEPLEAGPQPAHAGVAPAGQLGPPLVEGRPVNCFNPPGQRAAHNHAASGNASSLATIASMRSKSASISSRGCGSRSRGAGDGGRGIPRRTRLMRVAPPCGWRGREGGTSRPRTCRGTARRRRRRGTSPSCRPTASRRAPPTGRPSPRVRAGCRGPSERSRRARRSRAPGTARARRSAGRPPCALGRPGPAPCARRSPATAM